MSAAEIIQIFDHVVTSLSPWITAIIVVLFIREIK
jgi:hypothetical protein